MQLPEKVRTKAIGMGRVKQLSLFAALFFFLLLFSSEALKCNETLYFALNRPSFKFILQTHDPSFPVCLDIAAGDSEIAASLIQL